eukprot:TRINITY_DN14216_c2_g1_i1.p1 TRINITY_DN14216_c2_g1~~TRINITY_DN14216_c2_g1_i1.p1  ORF type:complete len:255 (-),score=36.36 TRINITY_DN14216_c2_g1_i1:373-1137(-)
MGCFQGKVARQIVNSVAPKEQLPGSLASASGGKFQCDVPQVDEGRRDFARYFFGGQDIYIWAPCMAKMRPIQPTTGLYNAAGIGDLSKEADGSEAPVIQRAQELFTSEMKRQLEQVAQTPIDEDRFQTLVERVIPAISVSYATKFTSDFNLLTMFCQPFFLIVVHEDLSKAWVATYGFVASEIKQIKGDRPQDKRTPFCARLLSPELLSDADKSPWQVQYSVRSVKTASIGQAVEGDIPKLKDEVGSGRLLPSE